MAEIVARLSIYTGRSVAGEDGNHVVPDDQENGNIVVTFPDSSGGAVEVVEPAEKVTSREAEIL